MTDALNEALMKLSAARSAPRVFSESPSQANPRLHTAPVAAAETNVLPAKPVADQTVPAAFSAAAAAPTASEIAIASAYCSPHSPLNVPAVSAAPVVSADPVVSAPISMPPVSATALASMEAPVAVPEAAVSGTSPAVAANLLQKLRALQKLRELRGWVAAGIALALLVTIWDDLARGKNRTVGTSLEASSVDIDSLLQEFETAEPAAQRTVVADNSQAEAAGVNASSVSADYSGAASDYTSTSAAPAEQETQGDRFSGAVRFSGRIEPLP